MKHNLFNCILFLMTIWSCQFSNHQSDKIINIMEANIDISTAKTDVDTAVFGAGCFWCVEAQFQLLKGVIAVQSGYTGGHTVNPTYQEVCTGNTNHAEVVRVIYNPNEISYDKLLQAFFIAHDPTQLNRQGNDIGTQYRSSIFYINQEQKEKADYYINKLNEAGVYATPIVTEIAPLVIFYPAEAYHDNYYNLNKGASYCTYVITPKVEHFKDVFKDVLK